MPKKQKGGLGYLQYIAGVNWMQEMLKSVGAANVEFGDPELMEHLCWQCDNFWLAIDPKRFGQVMYSLSSSDWKTLDATYFPPTPSTWTYLERHAAALHS